MMTERRSRVRDMKERRKHVRFKIDQLVDMRFGQERFLRAEGVDLGETGICCTSPDDIAPYSKLFLLFTIPILHEEYEIQCEGIVVRSEKIKDKYSVAIQFIDLKIPDRRAIEACAKANIVENKPDKDQQTDKDRS